MERVLNWRWNADPFWGFFFPNQNQFADRSHRFTQFLSHFLFVCPPWPCADIYTSFFLIFLTLRRVSSSHSRCLSVVLTPPPVFPDTVRRQSCGLMVTWLCGVYCIVRQLPALPSAVLTVLSWMNEHSVLTRGATVSNNKSLLSSVKFCTLLDLVILLGLW